MMFWLFLTQKKANKEKTVMTLTAELTFQKILSSIEIDSDCVVYEGQDHENNNWQSASVFT